MPLSFRAKRGICFSSCAVVIPSRARNLLFVLCRCHSERSEESAFRPVPLSFRAERGICFSSCAVVIPSEARNLLFVLCRCHSEQSEESAFRPVPLSFRQSEESAFRQANSRFLVASLLGMTNERGICLSCYAVVIPSRARNLLFDRLTADSSSLCSSE
jgi:hypothetical protein